MIKTWGLTLVLVLSGLFWALFLFRFPLEELAQKPPRSAIQGWDSSFYYYWLRSAYFERPFDFRHSATITRTMAEPERVAYLARPVTATGRLPNKLGVGWAVSSWPFFVLADGIVVGLQKTGWAHPARDGYSAIYQILLLGGQLIYAAAGLCLAWRIVSRWVAGPQAAEGVLLCWLGSFLFTYQTWLLSMSHSLAFSALCWAFWCGLRIVEKRAGPGIWLQMGLASGLLVVTRYQCAVYLLFPAVAAVMALRAGNRGARLGAGLACLGGGALLFLQMLAWKIVYGQWLLYSYEGEIFHWTRPHVWDVLFSPFHGLFYWSPSLLVGLAGYLMWVRRHPFPGWVWTVSMLATLWVNAAWEEWWFGASYGSRAFEGCVLFFMLGTAWLLQVLQSRWIWRAVLVGVLGLLSLANGLLSYRALRGKMTLAQPVTYAEMWKAIWK
ncbi:MAG: hypothetical protein SFU85_05595 [Candidatus Methylacidiphilales bacterium]|nr:hypothetical protein [Candidatus Methylacidiphilales bacterium]